MSSTWGNNIKLSIFGESHGPAIGLTLDGVPGGMKVDMEYIQNEMKRRAPGRSLTTPRKEDDIPEILSGVLNGFTTGTPITVIIRNSNTKSSDYNNLKVLPRPSHADYTGFVHYNGYNDLRGGGHFSGRLTAPIVFAGALLRQYLEEQGIIIGSHIKSIYNIEDSAFDTTNTATELLQSLRKMDLPVINDEALIKMKETISKAKEDGDSVGGVIEGIILNLPVGIGEPMFDSVESVLAGLLFSIPGVKGVEFGRGFQISSLKGSEANDAFVVEKGVIKTSSNNSGGILGGITNGMPIVWRVAMKPTPSIARPQKTVNLDTMEEDILEVRGRHDPCIAVRAVPVIEAVAAIAIFDLLISYKKLK